MTASGLALPVAAIAPASMLAYCMFLGTGVFKTFFTRMVEKSREDHLDALHGPERKPRFPGVLAKDLPNYPPNTPAHPGLPETLTDQQLDENLVTMLARKEERLQLFAELLLAYGVDIQAVFDPTLEPYQALDAIETWFLDYLPERKALPQWASIVNSPRELFQTSSRAGDHIAFTLAADYALVLGEAFLRRRTTYAWGVNRQKSSGPTKANDGEPASDFRRPVLFRQGAPRNGRKTPPATFDLEITALNVIYSLRSRSGVVFPTSGWVKEWLESPF